MDWCWLQIALVLFQKTSHWDRDEIISTFITEVLRAVARGERYQNLELNIIPPLSQSEGALTFVFRGTFIDELTFSPKTTTQRWLAARYL